SPPCHDPWSDSVWIPCADGKTRRIKPGLEPLVDGLPGRAALLRGAGNTIVPQVAAVLVSAYMEAVSLVPPQRAGATSWAGLGAGEVLVQLSSILRSGGLRRNVRQLTDGARSDRQREIVAALAELNAARRGGSLTGISDHVGYSGSTGHVAWRKWGLTGIA